MADREWRPLKASQQDVPREAFACLTGPETRARPRAAVTQIVYEVHLGQARSAHQAAAQPDANGSP